MRRLSACRWTASPRSCPVLSVAEGEARLVRWLTQSHRPNYHRLRWISSQTIRLPWAHEPRCMDDDLLASSGLLKTPVPALGFAGLPPPKRCGGPPASEPVEARNDDLESSRAWFHCLTSSTAWLKLAGAFDTCGSARRQLEIHACRSSFLALTRRLGSF